jgi:hypothetical protein
LSSPHLTIKILIIPEIVLKLPCNSAFKTLDLSLKNGSNAFNQGKSELKISNLKNAYVHNCQFRLNLTSGLIVFGCENVVIDESNFPYNFATVDAANCRLAIVGDECPTCLVK